MRKINYLLLIVISFFTFGNVVKADKYSLSVTGPGSIKADTAYTVNVKLGCASGSCSNLTLGSLSMIIGFTNASCSITNYASGAVYNFTTGSGNFNGSYVNAMGYALNTTLASFSCTTGSGKTATIKASVNDAFDTDEGVLSISSGTYSQTVIAATTAPTTTTKVVTTTEKPQTPTTTKSGVTTTKTSSQQTTVITNPVEQENEVTTQDIVEEQTSNVTKSTTTTTNTTSSNNKKVTTTVVIPQDMKLSKLNIVGYPLEFKENCISYTIYVDSDVTELYLLADPMEKTSLVEGTGIVNIEGKDYVTINVSNELSKHTIKYVVNIKRKSNNPILASFIGNLPIGIGIACVGIIILFVYKISISGKSFVIKRKMIKAVNKAPKQVEVDVITSDNVDHDDSTQLNSEENLSDVVPQVMVNQFESAADVADDDDFVLIDDYELSTIDSDNIKND